MWLLKKLGQNVIFSQNHTETNSDDWTITKKTTRTIKHENFSKMKILKVDRWALSLTWNGIIKRSHFQTVLMLINICVMVINSPCTNSVHKPSALPTRFRNRYQVPTKIFALSTCLLSLQIDIRDGLVFTDIRHPPNTLVPIRRGYPLHLT